MCTGHSLIGPSPDAVWTQMREFLRPCKPECVPASEALGRRLAVPLRADRDIPASDRAAMDGFAARAADTAGGAAWLRVIGEIAAGQAPSVRVGPGECVRIFTGASIPPGADVVVRVEDTSLGAFGPDTADAVSVQMPEVKPGADIFRCGECAHAGDLLLESGARLGPAQIALVAACGQTELMVFGRPRVAVIATGTELLEAVEPAPLPHQIRDSNGPMIVAAARAVGADVTGVERVPDDASLIAAAIRRALDEADVVVLAGGVSVGRYDHVAEAARAAGGQTIFHGVAIQPGKPAFAARWSDGRLALGLPGNPLSALVVLHEFILPSLRVLLGDAPDRARRSLPLPLASALCPRPDRWRGCPARLVKLSAGVALDPVAFQGSADLVGGARAEGLAWLPPGGGSLPAGTLVEFRPFGELA